ncbi:MAG: galactokinase [Bacteroidales bacterium]|nr:galactokinase [Bacteroidales bacterium]
MHFIENISKEELNKLPLKSFGGSIEVVDSLSKVADCAEYLSRQKALGFDTETKPSFNKGSKNKVALLQLSTEDKAYLIRTCKIGLPQAIADILANPNIIKTGVAIKDDILGLQRHTKFAAAGFVDLSKYSNSFGIEACGLKKLSGIVLGFRISKSQQLSNWEDDKLKNSQKIYGATDAWVGLKIYQNLRQIEKKMNNQLLKNIVAKYKELYGDNEPLQLRAPGRINLIGEHTDYNDGFVLPCAVSHAIYFAMGKRSDGKVCLNSYDFNSYCEFDVHQKEAPKEQWASYLYGITQIIQQKGFEIGGFNCVFGGDVPVGAGMSSSAALESGMCLGISTLYNLNLDKMVMARIGQQSEHEYVGVKCGIMDQFASIFGKENHCVRLDCRSLEYEYNNLVLGDYIFVLTDSKVKHSLASSEYNTRREECATGIAAIQAVYPEVKALRDVTIEMLDAVKDKISPVVYNRCIYVIQEDARVIEACKQLNANNLQEFGQLLYGSHDGLSRLYQVSCKELDFLVEQTKNMDYVLGSRMMGGGFGGCTLSLIRKDKLEEYKSIVAPAYREAFGHDCAFYAATAEEGTAVI